MNTQQTTDWVFVGDTKKLISEIESSGSLKEITINDRKILLTYHDGSFGALNNKCNHMGGPLSKGKMKKGCVECLWHYWQFHHKTGEARKIIHRAAVIQCRGRAAVSFKNRRRFFIH